MNEILTQFLSTESGRKAYEENKDIIDSLCFELTQAKERILSDSPVRKIIGAQMIISVQNGLDDILFAIEEKNRILKNTLGEFVSNILKETLVPLAKGVIQAAAQRGVDELLDKIKK